MKLLGNEEDLRGRKKRKLIEYANEAREINVNGFLALFGCETGLEMRLFDGDERDLKEFAGVKLVNLTFCKRLRCCCRALTKVLSGV